MEEKRELIVTTEDRILKAAIDLMEKKGFKAVTTKEIAAEAGYSEMTLFRHFGTKKKILESAVERFYHLVDVTNILLKNVSYDLEADLKLVSQTYHWYMNQNEKIIMLAFQERNTIPSLIESLTSNPRDFKAFLIGYFEKMQQLGKVGEIDAEVQAMNFLWLNLGYFFSRFIAGEKVAQVPEEVFINNSVKTFVIGLGVEDTVIRS
ncbi:MULTISPECIES: TetR/AcrR family transcriptional regulator [Bacillaceae]|uniref:TetR/AcrR family transcriptional regulator n=1 Tax=Evansella alkalicola TaxID=745819 RepID=A0ABS6JTI3_9BACI|nr:MULTISPECIES: TetR/AcrR family transcriptional regulator [Bacillaceae]MBU9721866.1 TetR/AcrR family transcriptional regulator [Bacillus alkalicola]